MIEGGALQPLGGDREHGGHKGYCLAAMVDILCGVLSGANWGPFAPPFALRQEIPERSVGRGIGHFFGALRIDGFIDPGRVQGPDRRMDPGLPRRPPAPGTPGPRIPGDPEREAEADPAASRGSPSSRPSSTTCATSRGGPESRSIEGPDRAHRRPRPRDPGDRHRGQAEHQSRRLRHRVHVDHPDAVEVEAAAGELRRERVVDEVAEGVARPIWPG